MFSNCFKNLKPYFLVQLFLQAFQLILLLQIDPPMKNNPNYSPQPRFNPTQHPQINSHPRQRITTQLNRNQIHLKPTFSPQQYSQHIKQLIGEAEKLSIELLSIVEKTNMSNAKIKFPKYNPASKQVEQNLHNKFTEIEQKFRELHRYVEQKMREMAKKAQKAQGTKYDSNYFEITKVLEDNRYEFLNDKIKGLESSLQETKKNETRLLEIIQKLIDKYQIPENATFLKQNQHHPETQQNLRQRSNTNIKSYQPILEERQVEEDFQIHQNAHDSHDTQSIYQKLSPFQSVFHHPERQEKKVENIRSQYYQKEQANGFRLRQMSQDIQPIYIRKLFSKTTNQNTHNLTDSKRSLKSDIKSSGTTSNSLQKNIKLNRDAQHSEDKDHRMQFMIGNLKY